MSICSRLSTYVKTCSYVAFSQHMDTPNLTTTSVHGFDRNYQLPSVVISLSSRTPSSSSKSSSSTETPLVLPFFHRPYPTQWLCRGSPVTVDVSVTLPPCRYFCSHLPFLFFFFWGVSIGLVSWGHQLISLFRYPGGSNDLSLTTYPPS